MSAQDNGGPAFPRPAVFTPTHALASVEQDGMTLRDYFAAKAMQAAATNEKGADGFTFKERSTWAYAQADAMLEARQK